jgi:hypothetical protein
MTDLYGVYETNPLTASHRAQQRQITRNVDWTEPGLRITRLRLLSDPGFPAYDVSYCDGVVNGEPVAVSLPFSQLERSCRAYGQLRRASKSLARQIVEYAIADGVNAKRLGILDCISTLV